MQTEDERHMEDRTVTPVGRSRRKVVFLSLVALVLAGAGGWISTARAAAPASDEAAAADGEGMAMRRMHRILDRVGATAGQRDQIRAIWSGLRPQLRAERATHKSLREQMVAALTAQTINAGEVERLRKLTMANTDKISALVTQGMVASAQVLTPDQRKLAQQEIGKGGGHHHWGPAIP
jgi:Spy/CpxP family protein refolding chaperone